ncbi:MAG: hypothetical protein ACHQ0J_06125 [Candidatus Dormibacterales bacterium]
MIQVLSDLGTDSLALLIYPGLLAMVVSGALLEAVWNRLIRGGATLGDLVRRRPTPVIVTVALCATLAATQLAAPFNPTPTAERSVVIAAVALAFTPWAEFALTGDAAAQPSLLLIIQACWLLSVLGPAIQPQSLPPQVLGNLTVPALLPLKVASGFLYLLCLPAVLRLWPRTSPVDRRVTPRPDVARALCWLSYCGLFTTLFFPPGANDGAGLIRFLGITFLVALLSMVGGLVLSWRGDALARGLFARAVPAYAGAVLVLLIGTSLLLR